MTSDETTSNHEKPRDVQASGIETEEGWQKRWWILIAMSGVMAMIMIDSTVVGVALPTMDADLGLSQTDGQWIVNAYLLTLAVFAAAAGRLADIFGHGRAFYVGTIVFVLSSLAAGMAQDSAILIGARVVQGLGAAIMLPASMALVANAFSTASRAKALGIYAGIATIGLGVGPLLGGVFTEYISWRLIFYINIPIGIAVIVVGFLSLPRNLPRKIVSIDFVGLLLLMVSLTSFVLGLMQGSVWGWNSFATIGCLVGGLLVGAVFIAVELKVDAPLIHFGLFKNRTFFGTNLVLFYLQIVVVGFNIFVAIYFQQVLGMSAVQSGMALLFTLAFSPVMNPLAGVIADRVGARLPVIVGVALTLVSLVWMGYFATAGNFWILVPGLVLLGIGSPLAINPAITAALNEVSADDRGVASGLVQTSRQIGATVGIAILGAVIIIIEKAQLSAAFQRLQPPQQEIDTINSALSGDGDAADAARSLGDAQLSSEVIDGVAQAYAAMFYAAAITMVLALIIAVVMVRPKPLPKRDPSQAPTPVLH